MLDHRQQEFALERWSTNAPPRSKRGFHAEHPATKRARVSVKSGLQLELLGVVLDQHAFGAPVAIGVGMKELI
jgi:hypothetical protein